LEKRVNRRFQLLCPLDLTLVMSLFKKNRADRFLLNC
jgi:hypothetical protein